MNDKLRIKLDELHRKICQGVVNGKIKFTEHMDLRMAQKNLEMAVRLEEYEAAKIFHDHIKSLQ